MTQQAIITADLFVTCIVDQLYSEVGVSTVKVLRRLGVTVGFPQDQTCCGQPVYNTGYNREARTLALRVLEQFRERFNSPVIRFRGRSVEQDLVQLAIELGILEGEEGAACRQNHVGVGILRCDSQQDRDGTSFFDQRYCTSGDFNLVDVGAGGEPWR